MPLNPLASSPSAAPSSGGPVADAAPGLVYQPPPTGTLAIAPQPGQPAPVAAAFTITVPGLPDFLWQTLAELLPARQRPNLARVCKPIAHSLKAMLHADKLAHDATLAVTPSAIATVLQACKPTEPLPGAHRDKRVCGIRPAIAAG